MHRVIKGATKSHCDEEQDVRDKPTTSVVYCMEPAAYDTLTNYLARQDRFRDHFLALLFQICFTMECIFIKWPGFRHNDLKDDNILVHKSAVVKGCVEYRIHGQTFWVPALGATAVLADFGLSSINGQLFDNYTMIEQEWSNPSYGINGHRNHCTDLYSLMTYLRHVHRYRLDDALSNQLAVIFGQLRKNDETFRLMCSDTTMPTMKQFLLELNIFDHFKKRPANVVATFIAPTRVAPMLSVPAYIEPSEFEMRACPLMRPRQSTYEVVMRGIASATYFAQCAPLYPSHDQEMPCEFTKRSSDTILAYVADLPYSDQKLDPTKKNAFIKNVGKVACDFLTSYHVPYRWWHAVYTCAFVDVAQMTGVHGPNDDVWGIVTWTDFWKSLNEVDYENIEILHFILQWQWIHHAHAHL